MWQNLEVPERITAAVNGNGDVRTEIAAADGAYEALLHNSDDLLMTLVLPLPDHRGLAERSVRSWAVEQTLPRHRYEVIVVGDGGQPAVEAKVEALLGPNDRLIVMTSGTEAHYYVEGANQARGRWIFFSEAHVLGAPDCLEHLLRALLATGADAMACRSIGLSRNAYGRCEERGFETVSRIRLAPGHWSRLFLRGSAISSQVYQDVGGLNPDYGLFAEPELAARLHVNGYQIGYAPAAVVNHLNTDSVHELRDSVQSYIGGECIYRLEHPDGEHNRYFGEPSWWVRRGRLDPGVDRNLWQGLGRSLLNAGPDRRDRGERWLSLLPSAVLGTRWHLWWARLNVRRAELRFWWWRNQEGRLLLPYQDLYAGLVAEAGVESLVAAGDALEARCSEPRDVYELGEVPGTWMNGFHLVESYEGERFRWSEPVACLKLPLDPGDRMLRLRTRGLRPRPRLQAYLNGQPLAVHDCQAEHGEIRLMLGQRHLRPGPFQYLVLMCDSLRPWLQGVPDQRELGLPVFSVSREGTGASYAPGFSQSASTRSSTKRRTSPATSSARLETAVSYAAAGTPPGGAAGVAGAMAIPDPSG